MSRTTACLITAAMLGAGGVGCSRGQASSRGESIEVVGGPKHSFGAVEVTGENLRHTFTLRNHFAKPIEIVDSRKTCGCLSVTIEPLVMAPGGETEVTIELETRLFTGEKMTNVILEFDDRTLEPLVLNVSAFMVANYRVNVDPLVWAIAPDGNQNSADVAPDVSPVERSFRVVEFLSRDLGPDPEAQVGTTTVISLSDAVQVVDVAPWTVAGWRAFGFARESELRLAFDPARLEGVDQVRVELRFEHRLAGAAETPPRPQVAAVELVVRSY